MSRKAIYTEEERKQKHRKVSYYYFIRKRETPEYVALENKKKILKDEIENKKKEVKSIIKEQQRIKTPLCETFIQKLTNGECQNVKEFVKKYNITTNQFQYAKSKLQQEKQIISVSSIIDCIKSIQEKK